jgi:two-component system nitrogen regulation sensor histidine kinase NtrY
MDALPLVTNEQLTVRSILLLLVGALVAAGAASYLDTAKPDADRQAAHIREAFAALEQRTETVLQQVAQGEQTMTTLRPLWSTEGIGAVIYENGLAKEWSTKLIPFRASIGPRDGVDNGLVLLRNGWYLCRTTERDGRLLAVFTLVRTDVGFENRHVRSGWNNQMAIDDAHTLTYAETGTFALHHADGTVAGHVRLNGHADAAAYASIAALLWVVGLILVALLLWHVANRLERSYGALRAGVALSAVLIGIRALMVWTKAPGALYAIELFGPAQYASSAALPSLGDVVLHVLCAMVIALRLQRVALPNGEAKPYRNWLLLAAAHLAVWPVHALLRSLVVDAAFPLDLNMPFALTWYSIIGLATVFIVLVCYYLVLGWLVRQVHPVGSRWTSVLVPLAAGWLLSAGLAWGRSELLPMLVMGGLTAAFMLVIRIVSARLKGFSLFTPAVLMFTLFATVVLQTELHRNEHLRREALARKLNMQQDPITEYLFKELEETLQTDRDLRNALARLPDNDAQVLELLHRRLGYDHWNRYRAIANLFDVNGHMLATDLPLAGPNYHEMEQQFAASRPTMWDNLRYTGNWEKEGSYLARLVFEGRRTKPDLYLYLRLIPLRSEDVPGFTDLFIDEGVSITRALEGYSFARYVDGELQDQGGEIKYGLRPDMFGTIAGEFACTVSEGADHLVYRPFEGTLVVVSRKEPTLLDHLTIFSYLFLFNFGCVVLLALAEGTLLRSFVAHRSFRNRINLAMAGMLTISLLLIGLLTVYYVVNEYRDRNRALITEKSQSILMELEQRLGDKEALLREDRALLYPLLSKFAKVFFTDINLYGLDGRLLATSRPRVFKEGLMARVMDPVAFEEMKVNQRSSFIHSENIGRLEYQAAYVPFRNQEGTIIAYLGIPYFARQYGLQQEVLSLLAALINIYVFLILMAVVLALVISNRITEPLRIIRDSLRNLRLDNTNRAIEWASKDEIGELVDEYNRTLSELVRSAESLARSEREGAWREMAKQVAHEIKNPLTPMKLNIQMLQRSYRDGAPDIGERIERTGRILVEQIDALSNIASEFSSFAQMPRPVMERIDLRDLLDNVAALHKDAEMQVSLNVQADGHCLVMADREQMLRVFVNLVKNATQAVPEGRHGRIVLGLIANNGQWVASVQDNGAGIPEELRDRVFVPNFTTKSAGMGLGLAMVQRIVESAEGRIWFITETGVGTTFYVALPMVQ